MKRFFAAIDLFFFYLLEVVLSNLKVARDVLTPRHFMTPELVHIPIEKELSQMQLTVLANLITMTPGTLSIDIGEDGKSLFIHAMYLDCQKSLTEEINQNYVRRILNVF